MIKFFDGPLTATRQPPSTLGPARLQSTTASRTGRTDQRHCSDFRVFTEAGAKRPGRSVISFKFPGVASLVEGGTGVKQPACPEILIARSEALDFARSSMTLAMNALPLAVLP